MKTSPILKFFGPMAFAALLFAAAADSSAFPRTKETGDITLNVALTPVDPLSTASGTASLHITLSNGTETLTPLEVSLTGLTAGTYTVAATKASDSTIVPIGSVEVPAVPPAPGTPNPTLDIPEGLDPLDIATLTVSDATPTVVLTGTPTLDIAKWRFWANVRVTGPTDIVTGNSHGGKSKKVHGHVIIHSLVVDNIEEKRKFLLVAHGGPADSVLTIKFDGVEAGTLTTTKNGKMMVKDLSMDVRLAGVRKMTIVDDTDMVVAEANFFED